MLTITNKKHWLDIYCLYYQIVSQKEMDVSGRFGIVALIQNNAGMNLYQLPGVSQGRRLAAFFTGSKSFRLLNLGEFQSLK